MVRGSAKPDDRAGRRCGPGCKDAEFRRSGSDAGPGRFDCECLGEQLPAGSKIFSRRWLGSSLISIKQRNKTVGINASTTVIFTRAARIAYSSGGSAARRIAAGLAFRCGDGRLSSGFQCAETSSVHLHSEIGIGRRGAVVARSLSNDCAHEGPAHKCHQVHGTGGVASAGFSNGRICVESARPHRGPKSWALGLHGQLDSFQSWRIRSGCCRTATRFRTTWRSFRICEI